jgi:hypothetical protein
MKPSPARIGHRINDTVYRQKSGNARRSNTTGITAITSNESTPNRMKPAVRAAVVK